MPKKIAFTKQRLEALEAPHSGRTYHYDTKTEGLSICLTASGNKTFYVYRWHSTKRKPIRVRLGAFPSMTIEQARKACQEAVAEFAKGNDPQADKSEARRQETFQDLWDTWLRYAKAHKKERSWNGDEQYWKNYLCKWASRKLSDVTHADIEDLHLKIGATKPYAANRLLSLVVAMFNRAKGFQGENNPARKIKRFKELERERFLDDAELGRFFAALANESRDWQDFFLLSLLVGYRKTGTLSMAWEDVHLIAGYWRLPAKKSKSGKPIHLPLVAPALAILESRRKADPSSKFVFPSHGATGHLAEPKGAWRRILKAAALDDVRIHDLRRTFGSWQLKHGASIQQIGKSLGHTGTWVTGVYARLLQNDVKQSVQTATANMLTAGKATIDAGGITIDVRASEVEAHHGD